MWLRCKEPAFGELLRSCLEAESFPPPCFRQLLVEDFNATSRPWRSGRLLQDLFFQMVEEVPLHTALVGYQETQAVEHVSYQDGALRLKFRLKPSPKTCSASCILKVYLKFMS